MKHNPSVWRISALFALLFSASACLDGTYDLGNVSLKMTLGPNGVTLPLGKVDSLTVDSLLRRNDIEDKLIVENGYYAYKIDSLLDKSIDAIVIDPIRNVVPTIAPHSFTFANGTLPQSVVVKGFTTTAQLNLPALDLKEQAIDGISVSKPIDLGRHTGTTPGAGGLIDITPISEELEITYTLNNVPEEVASISRLYFNGEANGAPVRVKFAPGSLASAVESGSMTFTIQFPEKYTLSLPDNYGGKALLENNKVTVTDLPTTTDGAEFVFYMAERSVTEQIAADRVLNIPDNISYTFDYKAISNGTIIQSGVKPLFTLVIAPEIGDIRIHTNDITPEPTSSTTLVDFEVDNLEGISRVDYIAFTTNASNALTLRATNPALPLEGSVPVKITFPTVYEFAPNIGGLSGHVLTTTLDKLSGGGISLPLAGIRLEGNDAVVTNGKLSVSKPVITVTSPHFPGDTYQTANLNTSSIDIQIEATDMNLDIDTDRCLMTVHFSEAVDIRQEIDQTFSVPDEVGSIYLAQVIDATYGKKATIDISLDIEDSPVERCYFDNIEIVLPAFLAAEHPDLDPTTNTVRIKRVEYMGSAVTIARVTVHAIKDIPVEKTPTGKQARLKGAIRIMATANLPENTQIEGADQTEITLRPSATLPPLKVSHVTGKMDVDLHKYLETTTISLDDIRESLGEQNVELNLVAPQIMLAVGNPLGVTMIGSITLQPYDFKNQQLDPVVVKNITIEPAPDGAAHTTKLFVSDQNAAPEGYTLCRVEELAKLVKTLPSKIDISFDMKIDDTQEQNFAVTGQSYPLTIDYTIKLPLKFKSGAHIEYTETADVKATFNDIGDYDITVEDILIILKARTTLPIDLDVKLTPLDAQKKPITDVKATVLGKIGGYNPAIDGDYKDSSVEILLVIKDGDIQRLKNIEWIEYTFSGDAVGEEAGLSPEQYIKADLKLRLMKGITIDLDKL